MKRRFETMEMVIKNGFCEISNAELFEIDGGWDVTFTGVCVGIAAFAVCTAVGTAVGGPVGAAVGAKYGAQIGAIVGGAVGTVAGVGTEYLIDALVKSDN